MTVWSSTDIWYQLSDPVMTFDITTVWSSCDIWFQLYDSVITFNMPTDQSCNDIWYHDDILLVHHDCTSVITFNIIFL